MGRRRQRQELEFGSDSFLDVIANMVGIIIILIVIAGLRVSRAPVVLPTEGGEMASVAEPVLEFPEVVQEEGAQEEVAEEDLPDLDALGAELTKLREEERFLRERIAQTDNQTTSLEDVADKGVEDLGKLTAELAGGKTSAEELKLELQNSLRSVEDRKAELAGLLGQISDLEKKPLPVKRIKHTVTPISKNVEGEEVHFRICDNRVSQVPMVELIERLKLQAEENKAILAKSHRNEGVVGPVEGYNMRYLLERQELSPVDQLHYGQSGFRIAVSSFQIEPDKRLVEETIDQALKPGSRFLKAIKKSPNGATFTFWVYPDCYTSFRRVQSVMREGGLTVAARPIPMGMPITGSPGGSRSAGQ